MMRDFDVELSDSLHAAVPKQTPVSVDIDRILRGGRARPSGRWIQIVSVAAAVVLIAVASYAIVQVPTHHGTAAVASTTAPPQASLLDQLTLPIGVTQVSQSPDPSLSTAPERVTGIVVQTRWWTYPDSVSSALAHLQARPPTALPIVSTDALSAVHLLVFGGEGNEVIAVTFATVGGGTAIRADLIDQTSAPRFGRPPERSASR